MTFTIVADWLTAEREKFSGKFPMMHLTLTKSSIFAPWAILSSCPVLETWEAGKLETRSDPDGSSTLDWVLVSVCQQGDRLLTPARGHTPSGLTCPTCRSGSTTVDNQLKHNSGSGTTETVASLGWRREASIQNITQTHVDLWSAALCWCLQVPLCGCDVNEAPAAYVTKGKWTFTRTTGKKQTKKKPTCVWFQFHLLLVKFIRNVQLSRFWRKSSRQEVMRAARLLIPLSLTRFFILPTMQQIYD